MNLILIAIGGALGSVLRYLSFESITKLMRGTTYAHFPFHTLIINVVGSMLAGILYYFMMRDFDVIDPRIKSFLMVGLLGGFTTFSAFSLDFFRLFLAGQEYLAFVYAFSSVTLAILFLFFGFYLMKIIFV